MRRPDWYDYDPLLQMVREPRREPDMAHLRFLRWSMENRPWVHEDGYIEGPPSGEYAPPPPAPPEYTSKL